MRKTFIVLIAAVLMAATLPAYAELQTVTVGGEIRIRANYYDSLVTTPAGDWVNRTLSRPGGAEVRIPGVILPRRPIGDPVGGQTILSSFAFDSDENALDFIEQRTRLNVTADFSNDVTAFIELDSYDIYGEDFRSDYITGADFRAATADDVEVYQAYIEAEELGGSPVRLRIGRQELSLGSEWLVGVNDTSSFFTGLSFDGVRLTYAVDVFCVDVIYAQLAEIGIAEEDGDITLAGVYGSYLGLEDITLDAYWLWVRDPRALADTPGFPILNEVEALIGVDQYETTNLHTFGLRGAGTFGAFDFEAEVAYQLGDAGQVGFLFKPFVYGDDDADFDEWAANLEVGYTFDMASTPRLYLGAAYFGGEDERDLSFIEWLNPFTRLSPDASVSFNRLFSNWEYGEFLDFTTLSNAYVLRTGASANPTESVEVSLHLLYFAAVEEFDRPWSLKIGDYYVPIFFPWSFLDQESDEEIGWELDLYLTYQYSEDLSFEVGYAHFFSEDGAEDGNFSSGNGLAFIGGSDDGDADYLYFETRIAF